ncbi:type VI secretion system tube protein TssD [Microbacterium pumilum]|uniref:Type VI secretion system tube protein Hcp n=1 Tax=Microbacterium pumilum TaxID=344165 RepID=A0ABP5D873_9MICO
MALNGYARLTLNGTALTGDVSVDHVGSVDVQSDHVEVQRLTFGADVARAPGSGQATGRRQYQPIRFVKRIDRSTPLLYRALAQNERVAGDILLFDLNPDDGTLRHFFTVTIANGVVSGISSVLPDTRDTQQSWDAYEEVSLTFASITLTHDPTGTEMQDQFGRFL